MSNKNDESGGGAAFPAMMVVLVVMVVCCMILPLVPADMYPLVNGKATGFSGQPWAVPVMGIALLLPFLHFFIFGALLHKK
jgi:uncharacterized RDD family membrane protein YckC